MTTPISVFISYSRADSAFVDRLEADLQARNFHTWVDRRKLEGGQNWMDELQKGIDCCHILVIALSPEAVASNYVRMEYRYAQTLNKPIVPLEYRACPRVPIDLNGLQWINFKDVYTQGLSSLLATLSRINPVTLAPPTQTLKASLPLVTKEPNFVAPQPAPPPPTSDLNALYRAGVQARSEGNLERVEALWQQVLDRDPNFGNKTLLTLMTQLKQEINPNRIKRLRERARQAQQAREWGQEVGAWQALLELEPEDLEANGSLPLAAENQQHAWMYENALQFIQEGQLAAAKSQLEMLWQLAPYYGDPATIAGKVGSYFQNPRLKKTYTGKYSGDASDVMLLSINSQHEDQIGAIVTFGISSSVGFRLKGTISRDEQIFLKSDDDRFELKGSLLSNGSIKGTLVQRDFNQTTNCIWEVS